MSGSTIGSISWAGLLGDSSSESEGGNSSSEGGGGEGNSRSEDGGGGGNSNGGDGGSVASADGGGGGSDISAMSSPRSMDMSSGLAKLKVSAWAFVSILAFSRMGSENVISWEASSWRTCSVVWAGGVSFVQENSSLAGVASESSEYSASSSNWNGLAGVSNWNSFAGEGAADAGRSSFSSTSMSST